MALDPLEREHLKRRMAVRMQVFQEGDPHVTCISAHFVDAPAYCDLAEMVVDCEVMVIRNRSGKTMKVSLSSLKEMVRFKIADVQDLEKWLEKLKELKHEAHRRREQEAIERVEERKRLERKIIVRKAGNKSGPALT